MSHSSNETTRQANFFDLCGQCGMWCCRGARPPITSARKKTIETHLTAKGEDPRGLFETEKYTHPKEDSEGFCVFFDRTTRRCKIHTAKPETCVAGPITFDINPTAGKIEWYLKIEKICPLAGALYDQKESLSKHVGSAKKECMALVQNLSAEELRALMTIEEPETFKIGEDDLNREIVTKLRNSSKEKHRNTH